jgi:serine phosphatase RsbU (regulator of sigma subunit)
VVELQRDRRAVPAQERDPDPLEVLAENLAASEERYRTLFETMPMGVVHYDADGSVIGANQAAGEILGRDLTLADTWPLVPEGQAIREDGSPIPRAELPVIQALRTGRVTADTVVGVRHAKTGELRWVRITAVPDARDPHGRPSRAYAILTDLTEQRQTEAALRHSTELLERARTSRAEEENARERLSFLMHAGALVAATRDRDELLNQVTRLVVPSLADYCVVFLPTGDGRLLASSLHHYVPPHAEVLSRLRDHPVSTTGPLLAQRAYTTGTTQLSRDLTADIPSWSETEPEVTSIVKRVLTRSAVATPLLGPNGPLGVIVLGRGARRARFAETDVQVIEELGRRLAIGLVNTDAFAREHAIAETLQRSLLPDTLPDIAGLDIAVRYLPATEGADVGGDWYDAFSLQGGLVGLVIGDVAGHNIASASIMGQVRSLLRAYAIDDPCPARVLERVNLAVARLLPDVLASAAYAVLDPVNGDLSYANAGHPPPLIATGTEYAEYLDDTEGVMLGASADTSFTAGHRRLQPGTRLLLYTDGLIEDRHQDITDGLTLLAETLRRSGTGPAAQTCASVHAALLSTAPRHDDVCLLTAQLAG